MTEIVRELNYVAMFMLGLMILGQLAGKQKTAYNWLLILLYIVLDFILFASWNTQPDLTYRYPALSLLDMPFLFILGPLLYLIFAVIHGEPLTRHSWLHFFPALTAIIVWIPYFLKPESEKYDRVRRLFLNQEVTFYEIYFSVGVVITIGYVVTLLYNYRNLFSIELFRADRYIKLIIFILSISSLTALSAIIGMVSQNYLFFRFAALFIAAGLHVFFIASYRFPDMHAALATLSQQKKYTRVALAPEQVAAIGERLRHLLEIEKIYAHESLSLALLAEKMQISMYQLSEFLNKTLKKGFYDVINEHRVNEAKILLRDKDASIIQIAFSVGFNSKTTFNRTFKQQTGLTPSEFRLSRHGNDSAS
ncbi:MAG: helix-turn-helix domain-containing protein [Spirochaetota bacterium]